MFDDLVRSLKAERPFWFEGDSEPLASDEQIDSAEAALGVNLPIEYRDFLRRYGGGYFARTNVFSVDPASEWYIVARQPADARGKFVAVTDDETGGYYGFQVDQNRSGDQVYYFNPDDGDEPTLMYPSFLEYLARVGLDIK